MRRILTTLVALVALAGLPACGGDDDEPDAAGALVAAKLGATSFFSLDHRKAEEDVDRVLAMATGDFKKEYAAQKASIIEGLTTKKLVVTAAVPEDGVALEYFDGTEAQVLVAVDATTEGSTSATPDRYRARVLLTKVDEKWLISGLNQVG